MSSVILIDEFEEQNELNDPDIHKLKEAMNRRGDLIEKFGNLTQRFLGDLEISHRGQVVKSHAPGVK